MYRDVVESVNEILFQTDADGRVTFLNRAWGTPPASTARLSIGQSLLDFVSDEDRIRVQSSGCAASARATPTSPSSSSACAPTPTGRAGSRPPSAPARHLRPRGGQLRHLDDITARKEAEQSQRDLNRELEARVRVRTAELKPPTASSSLLVFGLPRPARAAAGRSTASPRSSPKTTPRASTRPAANTSSASASPPSAWPASSTT